MVLNKSKWDHKAKIQYLKKHNLTRPKPKQEKNTPKWSSKKTQDSTGNAWLNESEGSDWDSEDEAFLNHFYPQISEDSLSVETKQKLKRQIIKIVKKSEPGETEETPTSDHDEKDGIYLGKKPEINEEGPESGSEDEDGEFSDDEFELEIPDLEVKLSEFVVSDMGKLRNRKMLKNKLLENLLEEYGLDSYSSTVKDTDYNDLVKTPFRNVDRLTAADLHGFRIGENPKETKQPAVRALDEEELEEHRARGEKLEHARFHDQIKKKFGQEQASARRVLEINNFNADDKTQMESLNSKLTQRNNNKPVLGDVEDDLDVLLGIEGEKPVKTAMPQTFDFLLETLPQASVPKKEISKKEISRVKPSSDSFLDDLLGIWECKIYTIFSFGWNDSLTCHPLIQEYRMKSELNIYTRIQLLSISACNCFQNLAYWYLRPRWRTVDGNEKFQMVPNTVNKISEPATLTQTIRKNKKPPQIIAKKISKTIGWYDSSQIRGVPIVPLTGVHTRCDKDFTHRRDVRAIIAKNNLERKTERPQKNQI